MKEKLINNLGLKVLSLFLAAVVWLIVVNVSNPEVTRTREVPLEIENGQVLEAAGRTYEISGKSTVTVAFDVRTRDDYKVRATDFRAYVDLAELYDVTGSVEVKVEVLNNRDIIADAQARPGVVRVQTEELQSKRFDLAIETVGTPADEYAVNEITLSPDFVTLEGPVSQVGLVSDVGVEIDVEGKEADEDGTVTPIFYDANGNRLTISNRITVSTPEIQYHMVISKVKNVALNFDVSGTVADGYELTGVESDRKTVAVVGLRTSLATLNTITIPGSELNINGATENKVVQVDVRQYLPAGVELADTESPQVEVTMRVEPLVNRLISLTENNITRTNETDGYRYRFTPNRIEVTVRGLEEDLQRLRGADLQASADLSGMGLGNHDVELTFAPSDVYSIVSYTEVRVEVTEGIEGPGAPTEEAETTAEAGTSSGTTGTTEAVEHSTEKSEEETAADAASATVEAETEATS